MVTECNFRNSSAKLLGKYRTKDRLNKKKVNMSRYTPWRCLGGEEEKLLIILNLGTRWG
jgi:hypothetical protein